MNRNKQLRWWGTNLRGLATGGLQYGLGDEPDQARYNRMMEIAQELLDKTDDIDEEQAEGVAQKLMTKTPGIRSAGQRRSPQRRAGEDLGRRAGGYGRDRRC